jgi:hypothetical protein
MSQQLISEPFLEILQGDGGLSIVIQGSLYDHNMIEVATNCQHWRDLFPKAEIILSIAVTDILVGSKARRVLLDDARLVPIHRHNGLFQAALARIRSACDKICLSEGALPLPPIKFDHKINNINLQIVAAQAGLEVASGRYTLRIRNDMIFASDKFVAFYDENYALPRSFASLLKQRVMISPLFTLNPFTMERLPFHFSDWFHFGLTEDIRRIWDVPEMSLRDAIYHNTHRHAQHSNSLERKFRVRFAVEQYISFNFLSKMMPTLRLSYINEPETAERSMEILLSEFLVVDLKAVDLVFEKYAKAMNDPNMALLCVMHSQWRTLIQNPPKTSFKAYYEQDARRAHKMILIREEPFMKPVKFWLGARKYVMRRVNLAFNRFRNAVLMLRKA